jgi:hypothetical protein
MNIEPRSHMVNICNMLDNSLFVLSNIIKVIMNPTKNGIIKNAGKAIKEPKKESKEKTLHEIRLNNKYRSPIKGKLFFTTIFIQALHFNI